MALSASQSRSSSKWTTDLLDITHFPSEDGSRIEDSRIVRLVKKNSNIGYGGDQAKKPNSQSSKSTKPQSRLEILNAPNNANGGINKKNNNSPILQSAKTKAKKDHPEMMNSAVDNDGTNKNKANQLLKQNKQNNINNNNNNNNKPKNLMSSGGALLKKLFGRRKNGKYAKSTLDNNYNNNDRFDDVNGEDDNVPAPIVVKEYDPTSESVLRFNNYSRNRFTRDGSSVVFTNNNRKNNNNTDNTTTNNNDGTHNSSTYSLESLNNVACCGACGDSTAAENDGVRSGMIPQTSLSNESRNRRQNASTRRLMNEEGISDKDMNSDVNDDKDKEFVVGTFSSRQGDYHR